MLVIPIPILVQFLINREFKHAVFRSYMYDFFSNQVEVKAIPIEEMNQSGTRLKKMMDHDAMTFGGHRPPNLETKYEVTVKDKLVS